MNEESPQPAPPELDQRMPQAWHIFHGSQKQDSTRIDKLPAAPPWRAFTQEEKNAQAHRGATYRASDDEIQLVNAALYLRRPLLITGRPGAGKSTLAYAVAHELDLGRVLSWPISTKSTLHDGLYGYDAIGRLQAKNIDGEAPDIGSFIRLGPLGTALLPCQKTRVVLIDELDKSDLDLPNDLLNVLEEGSFSIPELERVAAHQAEFEVLTCDPGVFAIVKDGRIRCGAEAFPLVIMTSNGEREFPAAFLRRCIRLDIATPDEDRLVSIVEAHLKTIDDGRRKLIKDFHGRLAAEDLAVDQLLNAIFLTAGNVDVVEPATREKLITILTKNLSGESGR